MGLADIDAIEYSYFIGMLLKGFYCTWDCNSSYCMRVSAIPTLYIPAESADSMYAWTSKRQNNNTRYLWQKGEFKLH